MIICRRRSRTIIINTESATGNDDWRHGYKAFDSLPHCLIIGLRLQITTVTKQPIKTFNEPLEHNFIILKLQGNSNKAGNFPRG